MRLHQTLAYFDEPDTKSRRHEGPEKKSDGFNAGYQRRPGVTMKVSESRSDLTEDLRICPPPGYIREPLGAAPREGCP